MIKVTHIDHINMTVKNLEQSVTFYGDVFGFKRLKDQPEDNSVIIGDENVKLCLYEGDDAGDTMGIVHFGFNVQEFDLVLKKLNSLNAKVLYGGVVEWEKSRSIYVVDPNGYKIELSEVSGGGL